MISFVKGILAAKAAGLITIEVNGIGYEIIRPPGSLADLPELGDQILVHTHLQVLENELRLYGFMNIAELKLFKQLLTVSGMGAKGALNILGAMDPNGFYQAIASEDRKTLMKIPGIGKKSAQRLVFELKDKLEDTPSLLKGITTTDIADVLEALEVLGFSRSETLTLVMEMEKKGQLGESIEENIKKVLQFLKSER